MENLMLVFSGVVVLELNEIQSEPEKPVNSLTISQARPGEARVYFLSRSSVDSRMEARAFSRCCGAEALVEPCECNKNRAHFCRLFSVLRVHYFRN